MKQPMKYILLIALLIPGSYKPDSCSNAIIDLDGDEKEYRREFSGKTENACSTIGMSAGIAFGFQPNVGGMTAVGIIFH